MTTSKEFLRGLIATTAAFVIWGAAPLYFNLLQQLPATVIVGHRILWSAVFCVLLSAVLKRPVGLRRLFTSWRIGLGLFATTVLITSNWLMFVWAVNNGHILDASFGYYLNPLLNVFLGAVLLRESLRPMQKWALVCGALGVAILSVARGGVPAISLALSVTFGLYGLLRKWLGIGALAGLTIESVAAALPTAFYLYFTAEQGLLPPSDSALTAALVVGTGIYTAVPLLLFNYGTQTLPLSTIGFLQFINPSCMFIIALFIRDEPANATTWFAFAWIWLALAIFLGDLKRRIGKRRKSRLAG